jgi:elongation factor G
VDKETGQTLMSGMGTLHLEIKQHRMERDFNLTVRVGKPRVSYRETLREPVEVEGDCRGRAATAHLFAKVRVQFEPYHGEQPVLVTSRLGPEGLPEPLAAAAEQGIRHALESGELGYPVMNVRAVLVGGQMDEQLSNEAAFVTAGMDAVHRAMQDNIVLLEPWMRLEVTVPEEYLGPVNSDLMARRAEINKLENRNRLCLVEAHVPLRQVFDYADKVRSLSQGRASSTMEPYAYKPAPDEVLHALLHPEEAY